MIILLKRIAAIMLTMAVICLAGCKKADDPNNNGGNGGETPETPAIVSTSEVQYDGKVFVEAIFEDESKMYFAIISPTEVSVASGEFFYQDDPSQAYKYRGEVIIPRKITHLNKEYDVISIAYQAFYHCDLVTSVSIPNSVVSIDSYIKKNNTNTDIYLGAFQGCNNLTEIYLSERIQRVDANAFNGCSKLSVINLSENLQYIGKGAFEGCPAFSETIVVPKSIKVIGMRAFDAKNIVFNADSCSIAGGAEFISQWSDELECFSAFPNMGSITFGNNVKVMPAYLYSDLNPSIIELPSSVTMIPNNAFYGCTSLEKVHDFNQILSIGRKAFYGCSSLASIELSNSLDIIDDYAFYKCTNLSRIVIPNSVISIGYRAFWKSGLSSIEFGNSIVTIGASSFSCCSNLTEVVIPNSVVSIDADAFKSCDMLNSVSFGNSLVTIGSYAFNNCQKLTDIYLPNSIRFIDTHAFAGSMSSSIITNITCMANNPPVLGVEVFGQRPIQVINVPISSVEAYRTANGWSKYADVIVGI